MINPFKELETNKNVPPEIKKKLMTEIASILLVSELTDLFTLKFGSIFEEMFKSKE